MSARPSPANRDLPERVPRPVRVALPPIRRRDFWAVQALVFVIAGTHTALETIADLEFPPPLYLVPTSLFFVPVVYAALRFGVRGSVPTALWSLALSMPNIVFLHAGTSRLGILWQEAILLAVAVFVGLRVDYERLARGEAEARERDRRVSDARYRTLFDRAAEAVLVIGDDGRIEEANEAATRLLGRGLDDLQGVDLAGIVGAELAGILTGKAAATRPLALPGREGGVPIWVEPLASSPLVDPDGRRHVQAILHDVTLQHERQQGLEGYARLTVSGREEERRRIGRELHDGPLQSLMHLARTLDSLDDPDGAGAAGSPVEDARAVVERTADELRRISRALRPSILDDLGLVAALRSEASALARRSGIDVHFGATGTPRRLTSELELMLLRVTQEALHNVERHAAASRVAVRLGFGRDRVCLVIRDNGRGPGTLPSASGLLSAGKLGVVGMEERTRLVGAEFAIRPGRRGGTTIMVAAPA
jgi:PAS domain S-box-containing protein